MARAEDFNIDSSGAVAEIHLSSILIEPVQKKVLQLKSLLTLSVSCKIVSTKRVKFADDQQYL